MCLSSALFHELNKVVHCLYCGTVCFSKDQIKVIYKRLVFDIYIIDLSNTAYVYAVHRSVTVINKK